MSRDIKGEIWDKTQLYIDSIGNIIVEAGKQMGVGAEHVYSVYTKQIMIEGIVYASITLLVIATMIIVLMKLWKKVEQTPKYEKDDIVFIVSLITGISVVVIGFFIFMLFIPNILKALNPEFYTMQYLLELAKDMLKTGK